MFLEHIETALTTIKQYHNCEITLTFHNKHLAPLLSVCYLNKCFQLTYLNNYIIETYDDIESATSAIEKAMHDSLQNL
jgi:hypothetical protein